MGFSDSIKRVGENVKDALSKRLYLKASENLLCACKFVCGFLMLTIFYYRWSCLLSAVSLCGELNPIEGLQEIKNGIQAQNDVGWLIAILESFDQTFVLFQAIFKEICEEIYRLLYLRPCEEQLFEIYKNSLQWVSADGGDADKLATENLFAGEHALLVAEAACLKVHLH